MQISTSVGVVQYIRFFLHSIQARNINYVTPRPQDASAATDPLHRQPGPRRPRWRVWEAVCGRRATLDRPRAAAASTFVAGVLQHPFGAPVDGTVTLQSALSLVCRSWRG